MFSSSYANILKLTRNKINQIKTVVCVLLDSFLGNHYGQKHNRPITKRAYSVRNIVFLHQN
ncbi:hypothetical protein JCM14076_09190 [Methylosoma difficile]